MDVQKFFGKEKIDFMQLRKKFLPKVLKNPVHFVYLRIVSELVYMKIIKRYRFKLLILVSMSVFLNLAIVRGADGKFITDRKLVKTLTLEEIQKYDVGRMDTSTTYSKFFPAQLGMDGVRMPTLSEVIHYVNNKTNRKVGFQIEFKTDPNPAIAGLWTGGVLVRDHHR